MLNTLEKWVPGFGKDRFVLISQYLKAFGLGSEWVTPTLVTFGVVEATAAILAISAFLKGIDRGHLVSSLLVSIDLMTSFIVGHIVAAERAQLQVHTIYTTMFLLGLQAVISLSDRRGSGFTPELGRS
jgi:hypothetical protein